MTAVHASARIDVDGIGIKFHCEHTDGTASYRVTNVGDDVTVYLCGTPEQMGAFADAIVRGVSDHVRNVASGVLDLPPDGSGRRWRVIEHRQECWCFVCEGWVREHATHSHQARGNPFVPRTMAEWRQPSQRIDTVVS